MISIANLAKLFKTSLRTIRYYEEKGLIEESVRIKGQRYYNEKSVIARLQEIFFLKSLNLKLEDIKLVIENLLYVKPIIINIRISQLRTNIKEMICAINFLGNRLEETQWPEVEIDDYFIFEKMKENFYELGKTQEIICNQKDISIEESKEFVHMYIKWCKKSGFNVTDEHIKLIASSKYISLDQTIKQIFKNYFL